MNKHEIADLINDIRTDMQIYKNLKKEDNICYILARNTELLCIIAEILNNDVEGE